MRLHPSLLSSASITFSLGSDDNRGGTAQSRAHTPIACRQMRPRPSPSADKASTDWSRLKAVAFHLLPPGKIGHEGRPSAPPASWPLLLTKEQLSAYLALSWSTISKICTVAPVDVGASVTPVQPSSDRRMGCGPAAQDDQARCAGDSVVYGPGNQKRRTANFRAG